MANYLAVELYTRILLDPLKSIADITEENRTIKQRISKINSELTIFYIEMVWIGTYQYSFI